jgi:hypothetical protein
MNYTLDTIAEDNDGDDGEDTNALPETGAPEPGAHPETGTHHAHHAINDPEIGAQNETQDANDQETGAQTHR